MIRHGEASEHEQFKAARYTSAAISVLAILLSLGAGGFNVAFLVALAFAVAASANVPVILLTIFWRKFNTIGAVTGMLAGLISSVGLVLISPNVLGPEAIVTSIDPVFPLKNPGIVSVPLGFLGCYLGTILSGARAEKERAEGLQISYDEIYVRANTGISDIERELHRAAPGTESRTT